MGISDRDYMRGKKPGQPLPKARAFVKKADNKPTLLKRLKFLIWNLTRRG